ncbi:GNAT family N-acetyltransferase [Octadecabacter sp. G9-8]|uniref:GNAT family N-acetyltransferase n=1 Tax=Octadecabacter dasysiphoniae TaxID=2909341 RepID=A0ABS9CSX3_9RHOB|nr:GNAT family N-acetyltransferase [Octadecabacter dasysiphoniae]MCF2869949.1 GNAT family N-acetyltransferase [Octadecabacter dasysiphoniae]
MTDINHATPADLPAIHAMIKALSAFHGDTAKVTQDHLHDIFFGPTPMATALIAKQNGNAVGYAGLTPTMVLHHGDIRLDIHHLFVHDGHRGHGIGESLILAAKAHAKAINATRLTIGTDAGNETAIAAYRAMDILEDITGEGPRFRIDLMS